MSDRCGRLMLAFIVNMGAFLLNLALSIINFHNDNFELGVFNGSVAAFSFILAMVMLNVYLKVSFEEDMERTRQRIYKGC
jgi:hypothetical protein